MKRLARKYLYKFLALLLVAVMVVGVLPNGVVKAANYENGDNPDELKTGDRIVAGNDGGAYKYVFLGSGGTSFYGPLGPNDDGTVPSGRWKFDSSKWVDEGNMYI